MLHTQNITQAQRKDTRIPASVHHVGRCTVTIYDEEAYKQNVSQYYGDDPVTTATRATKKRPYTPFVKEKGNRYNWTSSVSLPKDVQATSRMDNKAS